MEGNGAEETGDVKKESKMKLRVKDRKRLDGILNKIEQGHAWLMRDSILVCMVGKQATTTLDYENKQGDVCTSVNKDYGSELALLHTGLGQLRKALEERS